MKKLLSLLLCVVLLCCVISGCESTEPEITEDVTDEPLRICVDLANTCARNSSTEQELKGSIDAFRLYNQAGQGGPAEVELEIIPNIGAERNAALTRIRTEIMAGEGPDVFIAACPNPQNDVQPLFNFPEKAMASDYFLPLDKYIKKARFMEMDKLEPVIMEAGCYDGKQMILPMVFELPLTYYRQDEAEGYDETTTWEQMVSSDDPVLAAAASPVYKEDAFSMIWSPSIFGEYVDYENDNLLFTEEELLQRITEVRAARKNKKALKAPKHYASVVSPITFNAGFMKEIGILRYRNGIAPTANMTMMPIYNTDGGVTAFIKAYCAINRNTRQPNNAFFVADYFLSESVQKQSPLYATWCLFAMLIDTEYVKDKMTEVQREEFQRVLDQISCVRYWTPLDGELTELSGLCAFERDDEDVQKRVSKTYAKMQMMLAES